MSRALIVFEYSFFVNVDWFIRCNRLQPLILIKLNVRNLSSKNKNSMGVGCFDPLMGFMVQQNSLGVMVDYQNNPWPSGGERKGYGK